MIVSGYAQNKIRLGNKHTFYTSTMIDRSENKNQSFGERTTFRNSSKEKVLELFCPPLYKTS